MSQPKRPTETHHAALVSFSQGEYLAARVLVDTLLALPADGITREMVSPAIRDIKGFTTDMLCAPWYFSGPNGDNNANHQLHNVKLDGTGRYVEAAGCFETEDPQLADILAAEAADPSLRSWASRTAQELGAAQTWPGARDLLRRAREAAEAADRHR